MKNDICRFMFRHDLKKKLIIVTAVCAGIVCLLGILFMILRGEKVDNDMSNMVTAFVCVYTFVSVIGTVVKAHGMELCFNRSRRSGIKAIFAELLVMLPFNAALAVCCEYVLSKLSDGSIIGYDFKPVPSLLGLGSADGAAGVLAAFGFTMLMLYAISVLAMLLITVIFRIGKYAWVGFWVLYMLLIFSSDSLLNPFKKFASFIGVSTGVLALMGLILVSAAFTAAFILLYRKTELNKNAVGFARVS